MKKIRIVLVILICVFIVYAIMSGDESTVSDNFLNDDDNKNDRCLDYELVVVEDFIEVSEEGSRMILRMIRFEMAQQELDG